MSEYKKLDDVLKAASFTGCELVRMKDLKKGDRFIQVLAYEDRVLRAKKVGRGRDIHGINTVYYDSPLDEIENEWFLRITDGKGKRRPKQEAPDYSI